MNIQEQIDDLLKEHHEWQIEYETSEDSKYGQWAGTMEAMLKVVEAAKRHIDKDSHYTKLDLDSALLDLEQP